MLTADPRSAKVRAADVRIPRAVGARSPPGPSFSARVGTAMTRRSVLPGPRPTRARHREPWMAPASPEDEAGVAERALAEREHLDRPHREDVDDALAARLDLPLTVPLLSPGCGELGQASGVRDALRLALDHHVQTPFPAVASGGQGDLGVRFQVDRLLLSGPGPEMQGVVVPDRDQ